jgi:ABC-type phosphate/phosphonate transport system substrate-binding protein
MVRTTIKYTIAIWIAVCLCFAGCHPQKPAGGAFGETAFQPAKSLAVSAENKPLTLRLVVNDTYCEKTACDCIHNLAARDYEELLAKLKTDFSIDLQLIYCIEEYDLEDSIKSQKFDGAICKPWFAFSHVPELGMNFTRVADIVDPFGNSLLSALFIVRKDSPIQKPSDINGKTLALGQEDSYEKYHMAMALMQKEGIKPGKMIQKSSCTEGINMLLDNTAEVAVISDYALVASCAVDLVDKDAFRTIWKTGNIPLCSVILDLDKVRASDAARLQDALLRISVSGVPENFCSKGFVKPVSWTPEPFKK